MAIKAVLSDMDGTLLDAEDIYSALDLAYSLKYSLHIAADTFEALRGAGAEHFYKIFADQSAQFKADFPTVEAFELDRLNTYYQMLQDKPELVKPVSSVLKSYKSQIKQGQPALIVTNSTMTTVEKTMQAMGIKDKFWASAVTSDYVLKQGHQMKPYGDPYHLGMNKLSAQFNENYNPENCLVLEDSVVGVRSGMNFGGHILHIVGVPSQMLCAQKVSDIRQASSYKAQTKDAQSYTVCDPASFDDAYDYVMSESRKAKGLAPYKAFI